MTCERCRESAKFQQYRPTTLTTLFGKLRYDRAYYHCRHCGRGHFPTDAQMHIAGRKTSAAEEVIALAGITESFDQSAPTLLTKMTGLRVSKSSVCRTTEAAGERLAAHRAAGKTVGPQAAWSWNRDAAGSTVAYVSLDATGVPQQGPRHEKAEGRMAQVGCVFNPQPDGADHADRPQRPQRLQDARYVAGLLSQPEVGQQIRRECQAVGVEQADAVIALTDGGGGLQETLQTALAGLARVLWFVLDFYHVRDHLQDFAKVLWHQDEAQRQAGLSRWCHVAKHEGGEKLLAELESLQLPRGRPDVAEAHRLLTHYIRSNQHRMDYPQYVANGWHIGSGVIESACKSVVGGRLKGPGMRWRPAGTTAVCQLRALFKSKGNLWDHYWRTTAA